MQCPKCGGKVKFISGGHGNSGAPGLYFYVGVAFLYIAILLFFFGVFLWPWLFAAFSAMFVGWSLVARTEGYGNRCVECDHACPRYPWSL
jgi:hypothetical protein